ncbi:uncharacterized protein [Nothobranchius furzeri]|uniref:uncharacterized protein n=1 Tax=Nothobranchius furzeri TaxID=105023 RepID=UPI003904A30D
MIQGAAMTRQQRRRAEKYAQLSFDPSRLEQIMLLTEENNKLKSKLEETQEHFSKATGLPLEGYQLRQQCINLEKQFQASQNQLMESESMRIADRNYISELVQNIQSLQSELEIAKTSDWKRVDVIADEKDTLFNDILIKLRHYKCEIFGLQAAFNEFSGWKGKIKTIHGKTDGLTSSISHLEAKLRDLVKEGDDMSVSKQNDTMVYLPLSELSDIKERNLGLEFEIKDLTTKNDENERLIQELRKKLENSHREEECKSFKSTIEELQTSEAALLKEVYELKETRSMCNEKINSLSQNIEKAEREKMSAEKISEELKQINQQLQIVSSLRDSNQKKKEVNIQESHLQKTISLQGQQIKQDDLEGRNEIHQSLNEKNKLKEDSQSSELQLKLDQLKVKLENKQEQYKKLHKDIRSFVETVSDNAGILLNKKEPFSNQLSTALENIKVYINNTSEGLVSRRNLHKKLTAKAAALRKAEQELESSNKVIDEQRIQLEEMKQRHNTELMELELASQEEITKYMKEISQLKDAIKTAEYELEYLKSPDFEPDKELPKKVEELTQELLISKEKQKQLQRINDKQQNECEELRKQISQLSADDGKSGSEGKFEEIFLKAKPLKPKRVKAPLKENGGDNEVLSPGKKAPKYHAGIQETSKNEEIFTDPWSSDSDDDVQKSVCNEIYPKEDSCSKIPKKLGPEVVKMDTSPRKTENQAETSETSKISEQSPPSRFNPKQRQTVLPPVRSRHTGLPQNVLPVPTDEFENSFGNVKSSRAQKYTKSTNELGAEAKKKDTSPMKTEKEKEVISSEKTSSGEFLDSLLEEFGCSDDIIDDRLLPGSDGGYRNETSPKEGKSTKSTNELVAEAKKMDASPMKTEKDIELSLPGRWSPKNQATTSETSKISEQSPPSRFNPKQRQTVLPPVRSRHTGLPQNVLPVPTDEFENSFGNENSSRAHTYIKSTNELGAEAKKMDTSPMKTEKEKEVISSENMSDDEFLDLWLKEFGWSDDIIDDRLLPGSDGGYRNETSPKEAKSTKSTNELGAEAKKMDTSPMKTEKDIELSLPGRWSPKNQATTSETSKISEQSPPSRFNPKQRQTVLPPVRSRHTGLSQNVLPVPTDEFENSFGNEKSSRAQKYTKSTNELGAEAKKMDTSPRKTEKDIELSLPGRWSPKNQATTSENSKISEQSPPSRFNPKQRQTVLPPVRSRHTGLPQNVLPVPTDEFENSFGNVKSSRAQKYTKSTNELGAEAKKMDTSPMKTEKEKEVISSENMSDDEFLDLWLKEFGWSDDIIDDRLLPGSDGCYRNETSPKEAKSTKSTNELGAEAKKMDTSPRKTEKDIELSLPGRWSPKNQATTSENSKISEQSPPSRFNPKQRQTVLPPVRSRHTGLSQNVLPVPTDEFENSFGNVKSSRAQKYTKSTNELGAEAKKKDTSPRKTEKEKEFISSVKKSPKGRAMAEVLDSLLEEFGCSDDIIEDRLLPGSDGGYRNETSPKEAKSTKSTNELGAEAKKMDTSPRKTEKDIELFLPGRWSPKNQATTSETSKISEQSPPSRFNPKQRQTVLPPVRSRHTGLSQNVLPVPTDEFENSFGNENSSRAHTYIKSTNELGAEAKKMDNSPMKTEKEKEVISSENMSPGEFLDLWLKEFGWSDDIIDDRLLPGSDGGYRNETSPKEGKSTKSTNELGAEAKKMDTSPMKTEKDIELSLPGRWSPKNQATTSETSKISEQSPPSRFNPKQRQTVLPPVRSRHTGLPQNVLPVPTDEFENSFGNENSSRAQKYTKSTNELGAEAKKMDTSPMKTEKEKEVISSENMSDDEFLDLWLKEFGWSDDIIDDRLLPGSNGGYRNETSPKEAKSTKSTNELGAEAKKMDTSPRKTEKDIELSLPGRWSPKNQATTSENSKISEQSPPSRFNPRRRQTVLPPVRSRHTGLPQNVLPVPTDEFENSFGNVKSSRAQKYTKSTNELGAEAKKMDTSPMKTEKEKELISSVKKSPKGRAMAEVLDSLLEEFGWLDDII